jgi:hypothetical protein
MEVGQGPNVGCSAKGKKKQINRSIRTYKHEHGDRERNIRQIKTNICIDQIKRRYNLYSSAYKNMHNRRYHSDTGNEIILLVSSGWQKYPREANYAGPRNDMFMALC